MKHSSPHPPKQCWTMWRPERSVLLARLASAGTRRKFRFVNIARGGGGGQHCSARLPKNGPMLYDSGLMRSIAFQNFKKTWNRGLKNLRSKSKYRILLHNTSIQVSYWVFTPLPELLKMTTKTSQTSPNRTQPPRNSSANRKKLRKNDHIFEKY